MFQLYYVEMFNVALMVICFILCAFRIFYIPLFVYFYNFHYL